MFFVYQLREENSETPFYIGKGKGNRHKVHLAAVKKGHDTHNRRLTFKIKKLITENINILEEVLEYFDNEEDALNFEKELISKYGRDGYDDLGILVNMCEGGRKTPCLFGEENGFYGRKHSSKTKSIISGIHSGKKISDDHKKRISEKNKGKFVGKLLSTGESVGKVSRDDPRVISGEVVYYRTGTKQSEETKKRISDGNKGKKLSEEHIKKISDNQKKLAALGGMWSQSDEGRKKLSETAKKYQTGKKHTWQDKINKNPDKIRKTADKHRGMKRSEESRARMSEAQKRIAQEKRDGIYKKYKV